MNFSTRSLRPGLAVLVMQGSIHCGPDCSRMEEQVQALVHNNENFVIFDMAGVSHADSAAIGSIVRCFTKIKRTGGILRIAAAQSMVEQTLQLTKLHLLIDLFPTVDQAAQNFGPQSMDQSTQLPPEPAKGQSA